MSHLGQPQVGVPEPSGERNLALSELLALATMEATIRETFSGPTALTAKPSIPSLDRPIPALRDGQILALPYLQRVLNNGALLTVLQVALGKTCMVPEG